jgi:hypothetical protein
MALAPPPTLLCLRASPSVLTVKEPISFISFPRVFDTGMCGKEDRKINKLIKSLISTSNK